MFLGRSSEEWREEQAERVAREQILEHCKIHYRFFCGLDWGKRDRTVQAIIQQSHNVETGEKKNALLRLDSLPQGLSYPEQCARVFESLRHRRFEIWQLDIYSDNSSIGEPINDTLIEQYGMNIKRVQIVSGDNINYKSGKLRVSRSRLFQSLRGAVLKEALLISGDLPHVKDLRKEVLAVSEDAGSKGGTFYRSNINDDYIAATSLAWLCCERAGRYRQGVTTLF